jgi:hypothetical protein
MTLKDYARLTIWFERWLTLPLSMARATRRERGVSEGSCLHLGKKSVNSVPTLGYGFPLSNELPTLFYRL